MTPTPTRDSAVSPVSDERLTETHKRLQEILDYFDEEANEALVNETERGDLWSDIEIPVADLRTLLALSRRSLDTADGVEHPDDVAVDQFAAAMKAKLAKKRGEGRGGWENKDECSAAFLSSLLHGHVIKGDPVDVANLAMMLHHRGETILQTPNSAEFVPSGSSFAFSSRDPLASRTPNTEMPDEEAKLVAYFRGEGLNDFGLDGDYEGWTPAETAINAMKAFAALRKSMAEHVIDAALAAPNTEMVVKALEWETNSVVSIWTGELIFGVYYTIYDEGSGHRVFRHQFLSEGSETEVAYVSSQDEAKAAAQADFDQRIRSALASPPSPAEVTEWPPAPDGWTVRKPTYVRRDGKVSVEYCHGTEQPWQVRLAHGNGASHALSEHDTPAAALTASLQLNKKG